MTVLKYIPPQSEWLAALDIGTNKVCCTIGRMTASPQGSSLKIMGVGYQLSQGLKGGNIVDLDALEDSILNAVHGAEQSTQKNINRVYVSIPGRWLHSHHIRVELSLSSHPVDDSHLKKLLSLNRDALPIAHHKILHVIPLSYEIDDLKGIQDPKGMIGDKIIANLHIITVPLVMIRNMITCIGRCHLDVAGFVAAPYASALATLIPDEMTLGVLLVDIGAGQTTLSTFAADKLTHITTLPIGGGHITNDIARGLGCSIAHSERLKILYGTLIPSSLDDRENITITQLGDIAQGHPIPKGVLIHIIRSRIEEIFDMIQQKVGGMDAFQCMVFTGGVSQLQGMREMAKTYFGKQVRMGAPLNVTGANELIYQPTFSTCIGLLHYAHQDAESAHYHATLHNERSLVRRVHHWFKHNF